MGYCTPQAPYYGFLDHGCAVYGGIFRKNSDFNGSSGVGSKTLYVPQYNLAYHWQRPYMVAHTIGYPLLLLHGSKFSSHGQKNGPPEQWNFDINESETKNRNLLTGTFDEELDEMVLWAVNEQSSRKTITEFRINVDEDGLVQWNLFSKDNQQQSRLKPFSSLKVPSALYELRSWKLLNKHRILARGEEDFYICDTCHGSIVSMFGRDVQNFDTIHYMDGELVVLDNSGILWHGDLEHIPIFRKRKHWKKFKMVRSSDHPRMVYLGDSEEVYVFDLREKSFQGNCLYTSPGFDDSSSYSIPYNYMHVFPNTILHHISTIRDIPRMLLVVSSDRFVLVDERMRGTNYLELAHSIIGGSDFIYSAPRFLDPRNSGQIFPFYAMRHTSDPGLFSFSLYRHSSGHWSSLCPIKREVEPAGLASFSREQQKYNINISKETEQRFLNFGCTRAIHVQEQISTSSSNQQCHTLFQMTNDGSIWCSTLKVVDDSDVEDKTTRQSLSLLRDTLNQLEAEKIESADNFMLENADSHIDIKSIAMELAPASYNFSYQLDSLAVNEDVGYPTPPSLIEENVDRDCLLSNIVLQCWEKYNH